MSYAPDHSGIIDMTRISVTGSLNNIAKDIECRRVEALDVFVTLENEDEPFTEQRADTLKEFTVILGT